MYLQMANIRNYNLPRTGLLQPADKRIYVFSFQCNPGAVFLEIFARSIGGPEVRIKHADFGNEALGSMTFELNEPKEIRIRLDWGIYGNHMCELALFSIDLL